MKAPKAPRAPEVRHKHVPLPGLPLKPAAVAAASEIHSAPRDRHHGHGLHGAPAAGAAIGSHRDLDDFGSAGQVAAAPARDAHHSTLKVHAVVRAPQQHGKAPVGSGMAKRRTKRVKAQEECDHLAEGEMWKCVMCGVGEHDTPLKRKGPSGKRPPPRVRWGK
ncbi:hypothetical protein HK101_000730 [Irineochytrium annulatum]|nr:hypothetical protein HK101_000730 [Irineochytrium annulatum]